MGGWRVDHAFGFCLHAAGRKAWHCLPRAPTLSEGRFELASSLLGQSEILSSLNLRDRGSTKVTAPFCSPAILAAGREKSKTCPAGSRRYEMAPVLMEGKR